MKIKFLVDILRKKKKCIYFDIFFVRNVIFARLKKKDLVLNGGIATMEQLFNVTKIEVAIFEWEYQINFDSFFGWGINMYNE